MRWLNVSEKLLVASKKGNLTLLEKKNGHLFLHQNLAISLTSLNGVLISSCENIIVAWSSVLSDVCVWKRNQHDLYEIASSLPHPSLVMAVDVSPKALQLASGQRDGGVALWKFEEGKFKHDHLLWGHEGQIVNLVSFHSNGDLLATGSQSQEATSGVVNIWSLSIKTVIQTVKFNAEGPPVDLKWLGHRRLTICNKNSNFVTVILMPTNYDQEFNMDNVKVAAACRQAFMGKAEDLMENTVCLKYLLSHMASLIQLQKVNELPENRSLLASPFFKSLVSFCEVFSLDRVFASSEILSVDMASGKMVDIPAFKEVWHWMIEAIKAIREINRMSRDSNVLQRDAQLVNWAYERPLDWQLGGPCKAFLFGRNKEGQLADAAKDILNNLDGQLPSQALSFIEAQQIECGKNATFVISSIGE